MKSANWKDIAELIGIAAIVASLLFVGLQMQQEQVIAISETRSSATQTIGNLAIIMEAAPDIWKRGLDGEELSAEDEIVFFGMLVAVESHIFNMYLRFRRLSIGEPSNFARNYAFALYVHPGLRQAYLSRQEYRVLRSAAFDDVPFSNSFISNSFRDSTISLLKQLDETSPAIPSKKQYVFW